MTDHLTRWLYLCDARKLVDDLAKVEPDPGAREFLFSCEQFLAGLAKKAMAAHDAKLTEPAALPTRRCRSSIWGA